MDGAALLEAASAVGLYESKLCLLRTDGRIDRWDEVTSFARETEPFGDETFKQLSAGDREPCAVTDALPRPAHERG
jgi:hypothetical protein